MPILFGGVPIAAGGPGPGDGALHQVELDLTAGGGELGAGPVAGEPTGQGQVGRTAGQGAGVGEYRDRVAGDHPGQVHRGGAVEGDVAVDLEGLVGRGVDDQVGTGGGAARIAQRQAAGGTAIGADGGRPRCADILNVEVGPILNDQAAAQIGGGSQPQGALGHGDGTGVAAGIAGKDEVAVVRGCRLVDFQGGRADQGTGQGTAPAVVGTDPGVGGDGDGAGGGGPIEADCPVEGTGIGGVGVAIAGDGEIVRVGGSGGQPGLAATVHGDGTGPVGGGVAGPESAGGDEGAAVVGIGPGELDNAVAEFGDAQGGGPVGDHTVEVEGALDIGLGVGNDQRIVERDRRADGIGGGVGGGFAFDPGTAAGDVEDELRGGGSARVQGETEEAGGASVINRQGADGFVTIKGDGFRDGDVRGEIRGGIDGVGHQAAGEAGPVADGVPSETGGRREVPSSRGLGVGSGQAQSDRAKEAEGSAVEAVFHGAGFNRGGSSFELGLENADPRDSGGSFPNSKDRSSRKHARTASGLVRGGSC